MLVTQFDKFVNRSTQEILGSEIEQENLEPMLSTDIVRNGGNVTGVKGNEEIYYRTGNVNLTTDDIGALNVDNVYNGLDKTTEGYALDARQGKALADTTADLNNKIIRLQDKFDAIDVDETSDGDGDITINLDNTTYALIGCTPDRTGITGGYTGVFFVLPYGATTGGKYLAKILKDDMSILRNQKVLFKVNYISRAN